MYELEFSDAAKKQFYKLERDMQKRIGSALERIKVRPEHFVGGVVNTSAYKLRVGDYRVILDSNENKLIILVIKIGHRKNVYT